MNVVLSVVLVIKFGIIGVTIGTFCALLFRTLQYATYSSQVVLNRSVWIMLKQLVVSIVEGTVTYFFITKLVRMYIIKNIALMKDWLVLAVITAVTTAIVIIVFSFLFYRKENKMLMKKILGVFAR